MNARSNKKLNPKELIEIERCFYGLTQKELEDHEELISRSEDNSWMPSLTWSEILEKNRVILLASAGSGKSYEMKRQQKLLINEGKAAFYIPLEELSEERLEDIFIPDEIIRFNKWKTGETVAWFFLDAVDELKLAQGKLNVALRRLRNAVDGDLHRVRIIISSRPSDWKIPTDESSFIELLPVPSVREEIEGNGEKMFLDTIENIGQGKSRSKKLEPLDNRPYTILLLPLSDNNVKQFAEQQGVLNSELFLNEIERHNSWIFARRPHDLLDLINLWNVDNRVGTKLEQHEQNVFSKLKDNSDRPDARELSHEQLIEGAARLALAMALTRKRTIKVPDTQIELDSHEPMLDSMELLQDWTAQQRASLLRRAIFDPATFGRVRFHHRSVQEYLAAKRIAQLKSKGMSIKAVFRLLFSDKYGENIVIPSMRPIAAWLSIWDCHVRKEIIAREPELLLENGDPSSLDIPTRSLIIRELVDRSGFGGWRGMRFSTEQIERVAHPDLAEVITQSWRKGPDNPEIQDLLLDLIWKGKVYACKDIAVQIAQSTTATIDHRITAFRSLTACAAKSDLSAIADNILVSSENWPHDLIGNVLPDLFPSYIGVRDLIYLIERDDIRHEKISYDSYRWSLLRIINDRSCSFDKIELRRLLTELVCRSTVPANSWRDLGSGTV